MITQFAKIALGLSLLLSAPVAAPALSAAKQHGEANCPYAKRIVQKKIAASKPVVAAPQPRSLMIVEHRKRDVQILSFGP